MSNRVRIEIFCCGVEDSEKKNLFAGLAVGLKNWLRITFAADQTSLEEGLGRLKSFCHRHSKEQ